MNNIKNISKITMFVNKKIDRLIHAKQFDAQSRFLEITLINNDGSPFDLNNTRVQFNGLKSDGNYIVNDCEIIDSNSGIFMVELTDQALSIGNSLINCDISIFSLDGNKILSTRNFIIEIESTIRNDDAIESSNEYGSVVNLFQDVWEMREIIKDIHSLFGNITDDLKEGEMAAGTSTLGALNNIWNYLKTQSTAGIVEKVDFIKDNLGEANSNLPDEKTLFDYIRHIGNRGVVKYHQFDRITVKGSGTRVDLMQSVNPDKTIIILDGYMGLNIEVDTRLYTIPTLYEKTANYFVIGDATNNKLTGRVSYQLIEFY